MHAKLLGYWAVVAIVGLSSIGAANANTYSVDGIFSNGALLTGTIGVNNGALLSADLNADGSIPGDGATFWNGRVTCEKESCDPLLVSPIFYTVGLSLVRETYDASTQTYDFFFNGGAILAWLNFDFTLEPSGTSGLITGGNDFDPACGPPDICPVGASLIGGSLLTTPAPAALPLFAFGLGAIGLLGWRRKRMYTAAHSSV